MMDRLVYFMNTPKVNRGMAQSAIRLQVSKEHLILALVFLAQIQVTLFFV